MWIGSVVTKNVILPPAQQITSFRPGGLSFLSVMYYLA